jgi:hypothetical protein
MQNIENKIRSEIKNSKHRKILFQNLSRKLLKFVTEKLKLRD